jgi:hypothetical protein
MIKTFGYATTRFTFREENALIQGFDKESYGICLGTYLQVVSLHHSSILKDITRSDTMECRDCRKVFDPEESCCRCDTCVRENKNWDVKDERYSNLYQKDMDGEWDVYKIRRDMWCRKVCILQNIKRKVYLDENVTSRDFEQGRNVPIEKEDFVLM